MLDFKTKPYNRLEPCFLLNKLKIHQLLVDESTTYSKIFATICCEIVFLIIYQRDKIDSAASLPLLSAAFIEPFSK